MGAAPGGFSGGLPALDRNTVAEIQNNLGNLGFRPGPIDGLYGPRTAQAIGDYQRVRGGVPDGRISPGLLQSLRADAQSRRF